MTDERRDIFGILWIKNKVGKWTTYVGGIGRFVGGFIEEPDVDNLTLEQKSVAVAILRDIVDYIKHSSEPSADARAIVARLDRETLRYLEEMAVEQFGTSHNPFLNFVKFGGRR